MQSIPPEKSIQVQWVIWVMLLMGPLVIAVISFAVLQKAAVAPPPNLDILIWISGAALVMIPIAFGVRAAIFRKARVDGVLPPGVYAQGNVIYWAGCEGVAIMGIVFAMPRQTFWPTILFSAAALLLQAAVFPRWSAIRPRPDTFQID